MTTFDESATTLTPGRHDADWASTASSAPSTPSAPLSTTSTAPVPSTSATATNRRSPGLATKPSRSPSAQRSLITTPASATCEHNARTVVCASCVVVVPRAVNSDGVDHTTTVTAAAAASTAPSTGQRSRVTVAAGSGGAKKASAPASIDFGGVPVNTQTSAPLSVVNTGNAPATVTLSSSDAAFTVAPSGATSVTGGSTGTFTATFAPGSSVTPEQAMVALDVDAGDVLCAPLPSAATLSGTGTTGSVSYSPVALDFGAVNCGTTAAAQTITFSNSGNQGYTVTPSLGKGASSAFTFSLSPSSGVAAQDGGTVVITVTPKPIPQSSAVTPNLYGDTLTVTTDVSGDSAHSIPLRESARGAIFSISSGSLGFGSVPVGVTASSQFTVSNSGTQQGTLTFAPVQPTLFSLPATLTLTGGTSSSENARFTPMAVMAYSDMASVGVTSSTVLCAPLPFTTLSLSGTGSAGNVVAVSTSALTFGAGGLVPCGTQASAKTFDVTNNSSQTLTFSFTLGADAASPYTVTGPGTLAPGASGTVTVTPKPIPSTASVAADGFADSLTVAATGGPVNETHVVELHQTAQGAILSFNPTGLNFSGSGTKNFTVNNTGNLAAPYTLTVGGTNSGDFSVTPTSGTAAANGSVASSVTFSKPLLSGARSGNVAMSTNVARCAPLPSPMTLSNP